MYEPADRCVRVAQSYTGVQQCIAQVAQCSGDRRQDGGEDVLELLGGEAEDTVVGAAMACLLQRASALVWWLGWRVLRACVVKELVDVLLEDQRPRHDLQRAGHVLLWVLRSASTLAPCWSPCSARHAAPAPRPVCHSEVADSQHTQ